MFLTSWLTTLTFTFTPRLAPRQLLAASPRFLRASSPRCMPEGPEVKLHAEALDALLSNTTLEHCAIRSGRYASGKEPEGWRTLMRALPISITSVNSKGKFMWLELSRPDGPQLTLWTTLGMTGAWSLRRDAYTCVLEFPLLSLSQHDLYRVSIYARVAVAAYRAGMTGLLVVRVVAVSQE